MSRIISLYRKYFQRSRAFLLPTLEIRKGGSITPIQTYVSLEGKVDHKDKKLICLYYLRNDAEYKAYEKERLMGNVLFEKFIEVGGQQPMGIYIFNLSCYSQDWDHFLKGKYSKFSPSLKKRIKDFHRNNPSNYVYIESFLHPDKYYAIYAELLGVSMEILKEAGELTDKPDWDKETLRIDTTETFNLTHKQQAK